MAYQHSPRFLKIVDDARKRVREASVDDVKAMLDLSPREVAIFLPLILIVLWMGIYPASFTSITGPTIDQLISNYQVAIGPTQPGSMIAPAEAAPLRLP